MTEPTQFAADHPDPHMMCERYLLGELTEEERAGFEYHMFNCTTCFHSVQAGAEFIRSIKSAAARKKAKASTLILCLLVIAAAAVLVRFPYKVAESIPFVIAGGCFIAMGISVLLRYSQRFREFWARHVCAFMEEHGREEN